MNLNIMKNKIIAVAMFLVLVFSFTPVYKASAISEVGIRDICRQEIAIDRETETPSSDLTNRIAALETKTSALESMIRAINNFLVQIIGMISKLVLK